MTIDGNRRPQSVLGIRQAQTAAQRPTRCFACGTPLAHLYSSAARLDRCPACGTRAK